MKTLYKLGAAGALQIWTVRELSENSIEIIWGYDGGVCQKQVEIIEINQSGRSLKEQMFLRMTSRINAQLDKGYCETKEEAMLSKGLNASKLFRPMLAQVYEHNKQYGLKNMFWQYKYNGHRCLITRRGDKLFAYSRNGKPIDTIHHILKELDIPEGCTLDGELYLHGMPLQSISSIVRRVQPDNTKLNYIVYDVIQNKPFKDRLNFIAKLNMPTKVIIACTLEAPTKDMLTNEGIKYEAHSKGYEGFILRTNDRGYEPGKRSSQLLKVKSRLDMEVIVKTIEPSADGWAVLVCCTPSGKQVKVVAPGTMHEKHEIYENSKNYIGRLLTIEFAEYTKDGIPFHPVAIAFREEE